VLIGQHDICMSFGAMGNINAQPLAELLLRVMAARLIMKPFIGCIIQSPPIKNLHQRIQTPCKIGIKDA
jgi:hypothetical protein